MRCCCSYSDASILDDQVEQVTRPEVRVKYGSAVGGGGVDQLFPGHWRRACVGDVDLPSVRHRISDDPRKIPYRGPAAQLLSIPSLDLWSLPLKIVGGQGLTKIVKQPVERAEIHRRGGWWLRCSDLFQGDCGRRNILHQNADGGLRAPYPPLTRLLAINQHRVFGWVGKCLSTVRGFSRLGETIEADKIRLEVREIPLAVGNLICGGGGRQRGAVSVLAQSQSNDRHRFAAPASPSTPSRSALPAAP